MEGKTEAWRGDGVELGWPLSSYAAGSWVLLRRGAMRKASLGRNRVSSGEHGPCGGRGW